MLKNKIPWSSYDDYPQRGTIPILNMDVLLDVFYREGGKMANPDLETLQRLCPEMAKILRELEEFRQEYEQNPTTLSYRVTPGQFDSIAACIVELARHLREAYCSLYGVEDGNKLFEGLINGMNMNNRKERG